MSLIPHDMMYGPQAAFIAESFTGRLRYSGASLGYQLASVIAGGPAPLIATWLYGQYKSGYAIALYILVCAAITLIAAALMKDYTGKDIEGEMVSAVQNVGPTMSSTQPLVAQGASAKEAAKPPSSIGSEMSIVGTIECRGFAQVFGRVEGELRGLELVIGEGAQIEGNVVAEDVTIRGRVKGTVRGVRVKLQRGGAVEGDIFHRSLSIEESSLFEGSSRRVENPADSSSGDSKAAPEKPSPAPIRVVSSADPEER
jgi:cytoskeletal protein CcmA (bactofilin family)